MTDSVLTPAGTVKVKRDGKRGFHFVDQAKYDVNKSAYQLLDDPRVKPAAPKAERGGQQQMQGGGQQQQQTAPTGKSREDLRAIVIPEEWRKSSDVEIVAIVVALSGKEPATLDEAAAVIDAELALRAQEDAPKA